MTYHAMAVVLFWEIQSVVIVACCAFVGWLVD